MSESENLNALMYVDLSKTGFIIALQHHSRTAQVWGHVNIKLLSNKCFLELTRWRIYNKESVSRGPQIFWFEFRIVLCYGFDQENTHVCLTSAIWCVCVCVSVSGHLQTHAKKPDHHCISPQAQPSALEWISKAGIYSYLCLAAPRK